MPAKNRQALYAASRQLMHAAKQKSKRLAEGGNAEQRVPLLNDSPDVQVQSPAQQKAVKVKQGARRQKGLKRKLEAEAEAEGAPGELEASGEGPVSKQAAVEGVSDKHTPSHLWDAAQRCAPQRICLLSAVLS